MASYLIWHVQQYRLKYDLITDEFNAALRILGAELQLVYYDAVLYACHVHVSERLRD